MKTLTPAAALRPRPLARAIAAGLLLLALAACESSAPRILAQEPAADTACDLDGMLLSDTPGAKGQVHYAEGKPAFYCDVIDLFAALLAPEQKRAPAAVFVQDMAQASWQHPVGHWIDAKSASYVVGSKRQGAMGATLVPFARIEDARAFAQAEGGRVLRFADVKLSDLNHAHGAHDAHASHLPRDVQEHGPRLQAAEATPQSVHPQRGIS